MTEKREPPPIEDIAWVFEKLNQFIKNGGGSYRFLIFDTMGLKENAYEPLYLSGGMALSNFINAIKHAITDLRDIANELEQP